MSSQVHEGQTRPQRSPTAIDVEIDRHRIVYDTADRVVRLLDPVGGLIWSLLDGTASVDELADDLSAAFAVPRGQMVADLTAFVDMLAHNGLLAHGHEHADLHEPADRNLVLTNPPSP